MDKLEYIKMVDNKILPSIREQLISAFTNGFDEGQKNPSIEAYLKEHGLDKSNIVDFGLGTKWIFIYKPMRFEEAQNLGLQFPTYEQFCELTHCHYVVDDSSEHKPVYVYGPNGEKRLIMSKHTSFCVWTNDSKIDSSYYVVGNELLFNSLLFAHKTKVYSGVSYYTFFVLPDHLI